MCFIAVVAADADSDAEAVIAAVVAGHFTTRLAAAASAGIDTVRRLSTYISTSR